jgi:hypothetical protein
VIGLLRFFGILNAAIWFGTAIFFTFGAAPAASSGDLETLLATKGFPYFSAAISQILWGRYFTFQVVCGTVALLHVVGERLYLGKAPEKIWLGLIAGMFMIAVTESAYVQPKLTNLNKARFATNIQMEKRQVASESFQAWRNMVQVANIFVVGGLIIYLWHMANRADPTRFVSTNKFRS